MSSFWNLSDGETVTETKEYEAPAGGGDYFFPHLSKVNGVIEEMKWDSFNGGEEFINYRISVMSPERDADGVKIANRKLFFKLWVNGDANNAKGNQDKIKKKADTAKRMLGAIATNAGGGLLKVQGKPTNDDFATHMLMKPMLFSIGYYEFYDEGADGKPLDGKSGRPKSIKNRGNYLMGVGQYKSDIAPVAGSPKKIEEVTAVNKDMPDDSDIPF